VFFAEPKMVKTDFNNLLNSVAQQQKQAVSPQPMMKLPPQGAFQTQGSNKPTLITPMMFQATHVEEKVPMPVPTHQSNIRPEPLTQNQLLQALNFMLETDPEFIRKVHEAYVKSFNKIVSL
jgi:mRNA-decapping enzyme 1B